MPRTLTTKGVDSLAEGSIQISPEDTHASADSPDMRLLNTSTLGLEDFPNHVPRYAILSHRWRDNEVTFKDVKLRRHRRLPAFDKVAQCCDLAASRSLPYLWVDTCCIDKSSSAELTEAINSMFHWYRKSDECYVYLHDVDLRLVGASVETIWKAIQASVVFTRGWTLQELIAPERVHFFDTSWIELGTKSNESLGPLLERITGIDLALLCSRKDLSHYSIAQRLSWAATRRASRVEDEAYCLLGILGVHMPMLYGEGNHAFRRLQEEVIKQSDDQTIFAWRDQRELKSVLAPSPSCFKDLRNAIRVYPTSDDRSGYTLANSGLSIQVMLIPWSMNVFLLPLGCGYMRSSGDRASIRGYNRVCIFVRKTENPRLLVRVAVDGFDVVDLDSDYVAAVRDKMRIMSQRVILRHDLVGITVPLQHYGFRLKYSGARIFHMQEVPSLHDIVGFQGYVEDEGILTAMYTGLQATGAFRLQSTNGYLRERMDVWRSLPLMMYLGFDLDFAPVCLITSLTPDLAKMKRNLWSDDLRTLRRNEIMTVLDLTWLLERINDGRTNETLLAFRGSAHQSTTVTCRTMSLKLHFSLEPWKNSHYIWTVSFEYWQGPESTVMPLRSHSRSNSPSESRPPEDVSVTVHRRTKVTITNDE